MKEAINTYKLQYQREPYQPLSELIKKIEKCTSKSLTLLVDTSVSAKAESTELNTPSLPITISPIQIAVMN